MQMIRGIVYFLVLTLIGCAAPTGENPGDIKARREQVDAQRNAQAARASAERESILSSWHGRNINDLIAQRGAPTSTYQLPNGNVMFTWVYDFFNPMPPCKLSYLADKSTSMILSHSTQGACLR